MKVTVEKNKIQKTKDQIQKNIMKKAVRAGAKLLLTDLRTRTPKASGALAKSLASKVDSPKGKATAFAVIGPRSKFTKKVGRTVKKPSRYAHFIERGHFRRPFLGPTMRAGNEKYMAKIQEVTAVELQKVIDG